MSRFGQFTIRRMLFATAVVAIAITLYMSNRIVVSSQTVAVGFFGPGPLDYAKAHQELLDEVDRNKYSTISVPKWAKKRDEFAQQPSDFRSDWLLTEKNGAENFIHVSSSDSHFTVYVWVYKRRLRHQSVYRENSLVSEVVPEFAKWWDDWLANNLLGSESRK